MESLYLIMEQKQYKVIFNGGCVPLHDVERVKNNLANLFKIDSSQLAVLFQDRLVIIKKNIGLTDADLYRDAVEQIGGYCIIEAMQEAAEHSVLSLAPKTEKIVCPKCHAVQPKNPVCRSCGIIIEEFRKKIDQNQVAVLASLAAKTASGQASTETPILPQSDQTTVTEPSGRDSNQH